VIFWWITPGLLLWMCLNCNLNELNCTCGLHRFHEDLTVYREIQESLYTCKNKQKKIMQVGSQAGIHMYITWLYDLDYCLQSVVSVVSSYVTASHFDACKCCENDVVTWGLSVCGVIRVTFWMSVQRTRETEVCGDVSRIPSQNSAAADRQVQINWIVASASRPCRPQQLTEDKVLDISHRKMCKVGWSPLGNSRSSRRPILINTDSA
jgi:hypothetical protein